MIDREDRFVGRQEEGEAILKAILQGQKEIPQGMVVLEETIATGELYHPPKGV